MLARTSCICDFLRKTVKNDKFYKIFTKYNKVSNSIDDRH